MAAPAAEEAPPKQLTPLQMLAQKRVPYCWMLQRLGERKDATSLAECCTQICAGDLERARTMMEAALADLGGALPESIAAEYAKKAAAAAPAPTPVPPPVKPQKPAAVKAVAPAPAPPPQAPAQVTPPPEDKGVIDLSYFRGDADDDGSCVLALLVPNGAVSTIIGGGDSIRKIQTGTGTTIAIQTSAEMVAGQHERRVTLKGTVRGTGLAAYLTDVKVAEAEQRPSSELSMKLLVPNDSVSRIIGKQGATIQEIEGTSGARVSVEKEGEMLEGLGGRVVTLAGPTRSRMQAAYLIARVLSSHAAQQAQLQQQRQQGPASVTPPQPQPQPQQPQPAPHYGQPHPVHQQTMAGYPPGAYAAVPHAQMAMHAGMQPQQQPHGAQQQQQQQQQQQHAAAQYHAQPYQQQW